MNYFWSGRFSESNKSLPEIPKPADKTNSTNGKPKTPVPDLSHIIPESQVKKSKLNQSSHSKMDTPTIIEHRFGESLGFRTNLLKKLSKLDRLGLGPPDLIHFTIYDKFHQEEVGQYFYSTGVDISNESMAIAMMKMLKVNQMDKTGNNLEYNNVATFCALNIFSQVDLRIRYEYDHKSTFKSYCISCLDGTTQIPLTDELWDELFVSGCLRSLIMNQDPTRKIPGLVEYPIGLDIGGKSVCERAISLLCKFLPRTLDIGWDSTKSLNQTIFNNYLMDGLLIFVSLTPHLIEFTIDLLTRLSVEDEENGLFYKCALIALLKQHGERDIDFIILLNETLTPLLPLLNSLKSKDVNSFQLLNCISDLLNLQTDFLLQNGDYELALNSAQKATEMALDSFDSWYYLTKCYIELKQYDKALITLNSMPNLPQNDKVTKSYFQESALYDYYSKPLGDVNHHSNSISQNSPNHMNSILFSNEFDIISGIMSMKENKLRQIIFGRMVMPHETPDGYIGEIWDDICMKMGPIYGPQSCNSINFVPLKEVESLSNMKLLGRNSMAKQYNNSQARVYDLLIELALTLGWNELLQLRSKVFVMESEFTPQSSRQNVNDKQTEQSDNSTNGQRGYGRNKDTPLVIRQKRICERWLDQLFLDIYDDLAISRHTFEEQDVKRSGLEWQLLGLTMLRTWQWDSAIVCLRTSIKARFDPISVRILLRLFLRRDALNDPIPLDYDIIIELLTQHVSYQCRFYDNFQSLVIQVLYKICSEIGITAVRSRIQSLSFANDHILMLMDRLLDWVSYMIDSQETDY